MPEKQKWVKKSKNSRAYPTLDPLIKSKFEVAQMYTNMVPNRRRILRWFQKCIILYTYLANFLSYGYLKAEKGPFFKILGKTGLFRPLEDHNSKNSKDKHTKLYIFEISVKFCVDWVPCLYTFEQLQILV